MMQGGDPFGAVEGFDSVDYRRRPFVGDAPRLFSRIHLSLSLLYPSILAEEGGRELAGKPSS